MNPFANKLIDENIIPHDQTQKVYKYMSMDTAKKVFSTGNLRFSSPSIFNDPFELNIGFINWSIPRGQLLNRILNQAVAQDLDLQSINALGRRPTSDLVKVYRNIIEEHRRNLLLFCTSRTRSSTLMWSHYAQNHKGVCIGLYLPTFYENLDLATCNVHYVDKVYPPLNILSDNRQEWAVDYYKWINSKSKIWEYEGEVRSCILNIEKKIPLKDGLYYDLSYPKENFDEVIFGAGVQENEINDLRKIISENEFPIAIFGQMFISMSTFDLEYRLLS